MPMYACNISYCNFQSFSRKDHCLGNLCREACVYNIYNWNLQSEALVTSLKGFENFLGVSSGDHTIGPIHDWAHSIVPRHDCAHTRLCPDTFVPRHDCAQTRLCPDTFVPRHDCAHTWLCPHTIMPRHVCALTCLCPDTIVPRHVCAHTRLCPHTFVPTLVCAHTSLCPHMFVPKSCGHNHVWAETCTFVSRHVIIK